MFSNNTHINKKTKVFNTVSHAEGENQNYTHFTSDTIKKINIS